MKQGHTPIPRYRHFSGPALLKQGFRPFFLAAGVWAPVALVLFLGMFSGWIELPTAFDPVSWHVHEMIFGFVAAALAGFVLTTIPNWTGHLPLQGFPLLGLILLWCAGRVAVAVSGTIGFWLAAAIDLSFLGVLAAVTLREILAGQNWRNLPIILAISLFWTCNALVYAEMNGLIENTAMARRFAITVLISLITLIGGRIIPSYTRNWLTRKKAGHLPEKFGTIDRVAIGMTIITLSCWALFPYGRGSAVLAAGVAVLHFWRLARWRGYYTLAEPLLWSLHIAYLWIPIGFGLLALSHWWPGLTQAGALHAFTAGAIGGMILAVMSRTTIRHTGHPPEVGPGLVTAYILVVVAALLRICSTLSPAHYMLLLVIAAILWSMAFAFFLGVCGPMLIEESRSKKNRRKSQDRKK